MQHDGSDRAKGGAGLARLIAEPSAASALAVESWNPPYCGDIGLAIGPDGGWSYRGSPITRMPLVKLFSRVLRRDLDGRHYLVTPVEKVDVAVADAPFRAVAMEVRGSGTLQEVVFRTNVDDSVVAGPAHPLRFEVDPRTAGLKPYVLVRGRLEALVIRAVTMDLVDLAVADADDELGIWSGGVRFPIIG